MSGDSFIRPWVVAEYEGLSLHQIAKLCDLRLAEEWHDAEHSKRLLIESLDEAPAVAVATTGSSSSREVVTSAAGGGFHGV